MPAEFLSRNAIDTVGIFSNQWKLEQEQDEFCHSIQKYMYTRKSNCNCDLKYLQIADYCFIDKEILWGRFDNHGKQKTIIIAPKSQR